MQTSIEDEDGKWFRYLPTTFNVAVNMHLVSEGRETVTGVIESEPGLNALRSSFLRRLIGRHRLYTSYYFLELQMELGLTVGKQGEIIMLTETC